jgi:hypothetical protein
MKMGSCANIFDAFMKREAIDPDALTDLVTADNQVEIRKMIEDKGGEVKKSIYM